MEDYILKAKRVSPKYGENIINLLDKESLNLKKMSELLKTSQQNLANILEKMLQAELIVKNRKGRHVTYSLNQIESFKDTDKMEVTNINQCDEVLYKALFLNMLKCNKSNPYVSYFLKDIEYTFSCFFGIELIMLLFVLGICDYGESQSFSNLFGVNEVGAIKVQQELLNKFQTFLFDVIQKYSITIPNDEERQP